jgi:hypothetical protein
MENNKHNDVKELSINFLREWNARFEDRPESEKIDVGLLTLSRLAALMALPIKQPFREMVLESFFEVVRQGVTELDQEVVPEFFANEAIKKAMQK